MLENLKIFAEYNQKMNLKIYASAMEHLTRDQLIEYRNVRFQSIIGLLNHIMVGDILWLKNLSKHPARHPSLDVIRAKPWPFALDQILFSDIGDLYEERKLIDRTIISWINEITEEDIKYCFPNRFGRDHMKSLFIVQLQHLFNHQTHHRGQISALLAQENIDIGVTDLLG